MRVNIEEAFYPLLTLMPHPDGAFEVPDDLLQRNALAELEYDVTQEEIANIYEGKPIAD